MWKVMRQDDNNNVFEVERNLSEKEADDLVKEFESRGHKQTYWKEKYTCHWCGRELDKGSIMGYCLIRGCADLCLQKTTREWYYRNYGKQLP
jgi:CRISPR/Cas system-associated protein Cas10 (large subunit of type III CRISPR-Cas system)